MPDFGTAPTPFSAVGTIFAGNAADNLADIPRIRFKPEWGEPFPMQQAETRAALDPAERDALSAWLAARYRVDAVLDLSSRAWHIPGDRTIIGVFEAGRPQASWLIVAERSVWMLAHCEDGTLSGPCTTLAEILRLIDHQLAS